MNTLKKYCRNIVTQHFLKTHMRTINLFQWKIPVFRQEEKKIQVKHEKKDTPTDKSMYLFLRECQRK